MIGEVRGGVYDGGASFHISGMLGFKLLLQHKSTQLVSALLKSEVPEDAGGGIHGQQVLARWDEANR